MLNNFLKRQSDVFYIQVWPERIKVTELNSSEVFDDEPVLVYQPDGDNKKILSIGATSTDHADSTQSQTVRPFYADGSIIGDVDASVAIINHAIYTITEKLAGRFFSPLLIFHAMENVGDDEYRGDEDLKTLLSRRCRAKKVLVMKPDEFLDLDALR